MHVDPTGPIRANQGVRRNERGAGARPGEFSRHLDFTGSSANVTAVRPAPAVDALLAAQEIGIEPTSDERAKRRARDMLQLLDELRHGILAGALERTTLDALASFVRERRAGTADPRLQSILDEIELRAAVEIAKLESASLAAVDG